MKPATESTVTKIDDEVEDKDEDEKISFFKLFSFADNYDLGLMSIGTLCAIANGLAMPFMTLIFGQMIDSFGGSNVSHTVSVVSKVSLKFVYLAIGSCVASFIQVASWMVTGERQATKIRGLYLKTILRQDITFFDTETSTGEVIGRMSGDTILIQDAMGEKVAKFIQLVSTFVGGFIMAFVKGWQLALVLCACIPVVIVAAGTVSILMSKMASRGQVAYAEAGNVVEQTIGAIRTVASFTGESHAIGKYNRSIENAYASTVKQGLVTGLGVGVVMLSIFGTYGLAVWYGSKMIIENGYSGGHVINIIFAIMTGAMSLGQATPCLTAFAAGRAAAYKMFKTIRRQPLIDSYSTTGVVPENIKGDVELREVYFSYPARPDIQIFSGFSLRVPSGTTAALVGQSGSGKSTVISLIERFYDPHEGEVLIDGTNLKDLQLRWIREKIGLVSQEPILFATTIRGNITYGKENATNEEIRTAIEQANAAKFIDKLPNGLETMVGEHGTQLSGGQKQRIAIARAILKKPKILLLDEATSALDAESERIVQEALLRIMENRTTVVVAHRLTTIRNADTIAVVHQGKIVEQGTHMQLINDPEGAYSQLILLQEGAKHAEDSLPRSDPDHIDMSSEEITMSKSRSQRLSVKRSTSRRSSSARMSLSLPLGFTAGIYEGETAENDDIEKGDQRDGKPKGQISIMRLAHINKPETLILVVGFIFAAVHGVLLPVFGLLLSTAIKIFYYPPHQLQKESKFWAFMFALIGFIALVFIPLEQYLFGVAGAKLIQRIRSLCFEKVVHQEISWFDDSTNSSGAIGARLSGDAATLRRLVGDSLALYSQIIATAIAGLIIAFTANWLLALIILFLLPLLGFQSYAQMKFLKGFSEDAKVKYEEASQVANDAVGSIRTVASFCAEQKVMDLYEKKCDAPLKNGVRQGLVSGAGYGLSFFLLYCTNALIFYLGSILVQHGKATFAEVFRVFFALTISAVGISQSSALAADSTKAKDSAASIFEILDKKSKIDSSSNEGSVVTSVRGDIELQHISFRYPTRPDVQIFRDLSISIPSGKTVALVGESGSGKSTVISLLERFYDPDSGTITLDGVQIQKLKLSWLRQQMGLVSQEPILFNDTIRANIAYGKGGATEEEIITATKASNAHVFISGLPQGYDTPVGERGVQLSGGQKQRVAIARAIVKDPRILLLDEATSALDAESERVVQDALDRVMVNRTTIVVAHRLSTIKGADVIAVVKNGVIAERGRHEEVIKVKDGAYASLVALHMTSST